MLTKPMLIFNVLVLALTLSSMRKLPVLSSGKWGWRRESTLLTLLNIILITVSIDEWFSRGVYPGLFHYYLNIYLCVRPSVRNHLAIVSECTFDT